MDEVCELYNNSSRVGAESAFPNDGHAPSSCNKGFNCSRVALRISYYLVSPELGPGLWNSKVGAADVPMPEAPVHKNNRVPFLEDYVWLSRQSPGM